MTNLLPSSVIFIRKHEEKTSKDFYYATILPEKAHARMRSTCQVSDDFVLFLTT